MIWTMFTNTCEDIVIGAVTAWVGHGVLMLFFGPQFKARLRRIAEYSSYVIALGVLGAWVFAFLATLLIEAASS